VLYQCGCHACKGASCQASRDTQIPLSISQASLRSLICTQLNCTVWNHLQYLHSRKADLCMSPESLKSPEKVESWILGISGSLMLCSYCNRNLWLLYTMCCNVCNMPAILKLVAVACFCLPADKQCPLSLVGVKHRLSSDPLLGGLRGYLRDIAFPIAQEALFLANSCESSYDTSATSSFLQCPCLKTSSRL